MDRLDDIFNFSDVIRFNRIHNEYYLIFHKDSKQWRIGPEHINLIDYKTELNLTDEEIVLLKLKYN